MKVSFILIFFLIIIFQINSNLLRNLATLEYKYTNYRAFKTYEDITEQTLF